MAGFRRVAPTGGRGSGPRRPHRLVVCYLGALGVGPSSIGPAATTPGGIVAARSLHWSLSQTSSSRSPALSRSLRNRGTRHRVLFQPTKDGRGMLARNVLRANDLGPIRSTLPHHITCLFSTSSRIVEIGRIFLTSLQTSALRGYRRPSDVIFGLKPTTRLKHCISIDWRLCHSRSVGVHVSDANISCARVTATKTASFVLGDAAFLRSKGLSRAAIVPRAPRILLLISFPSSPSLVRHRPRYRNSRTSSTGFP